MKTTTSNIVSRILFVFYIASVCLLCFAKFDGAIRVSKVIMGLPTDKLAHFLMFFPFPLLGFLSFDKGRRTAGRSIGFMALLLFAGCCFASATEFIQGHLSYRTADKYDLLADCISMGISTLIILITDLSICSKK